jgi:hypothetical protein
MPARFCRHFVFLVRSLQILELASFLTSIISKLKTLFCGAGFNLRGTLAPPGAAGALVQGIGFVP